MEYQPYTQTYLTVFAVMFALMVTTSQGKKFRAFDQVKHATPDTPSKHDIIHKVIFSVFLIIIVPSVFFSFAFLAISRFYRPSDGLAFILTILLILFLTTPTYAGQQLWLLRARHRHWVEAKVVGETAPYCWALVCGIVPVIILGVLFLGPSCLLRPWPAA